MITSSRLPLGNLSIKLNSILFNLQRLSYTKMMIIRRGGAFQASFHISYVISTLSKRETKSEQNMRHKQGNV